ncbi:MAG: hypothetical protein IKZ46_16970 [Victivallales bacterium]|nr:hypothetical protein [Victivallales bacterium]
MKKLSAIMLCAICLMATAVELPPRHHINIWSGKEQSLPFSAQTEWRIESDHGRLLASGGEANPIRVSFPALTGKETAVLFIDGKKTASIAIYPQKLLDGITGQIDCRRDELEALGVKQQTDGIKPCFFISAPPKLSRIGILSYSHKIIIFTDKRDFPIKIDPADWNEISFGMNKKKGGLSLIMDEREQIIDSTPGGISWIVARHVIGDKVILLPPDFDLQNIDNILFIKKELEK